MGGSTAGANTGGRSEGGSTADGGNAGGSTGGSTTGSVNKARPFSPASPWNTPTPDGTRWYDTELLHTCVGSGCASDQIRHWWVNTDLGITWASPSDPLWTFDLPAYTADEWHRTRPATTVQMRAPSTLTPQPPDGDGILLVADPVTGDYVEIWNATVDASSLTGTGPVWATGNMITGLGVGDLTTNLNGGVRAANFSWGAGMITQADLSAGEIDHALLMCLPGEMVKGGSPPTGPYRAPATCGNGEWPTGPIEMGSKIGVPAGTSRPSGLSDLGNMVFDALQTYGAYVGDVCGGQAINFQGDGPSMDITPGTSIDYTPFLPLVGFWAYNGSSDAEKIGPLLRVADYQP
jgi:hypothetical protein